MADRLSPMPFQTRSAKETSELRHRRARQDKTVRTFFLVAQRLVERQRSTEVQVTRLRERQSVVDEADAVLEREHRVLLRCLCRDRLEAFGAVEHAVCASDRSAAKCGFLGSRGHSQTLTVSAFSLKGFEVSSGMNFSRSSSRMVLSTCALPFASVVNRLNGIDLFDKVSARIPHLRRQALTRWSCCPWGRRGLSRGIGLA